MAHVVMSRVDIRRELSGRCMRISQVTDEERQLLESTARSLLTLQLPFMEVSESMGNHDSKIVDAGSVD
jgi:hypothetical protein